MEVNLSHPHSVDTNFQRWRRLRDRLCRIVHVHSCGSLKVTIRPVFNGTVPFLSCLSRCPNNSFRDAQMSRFWVPLLAFTVCCVRCNRTNGNIQVFAHSEMHKFAYKMHQNRCRPGRRPGPRWERSKLEYAKAVWSPLKLNYIDALEAVQRMATSIFKMFT